MVKVPKIPKLPKLPKLRKPLDKYLLPDLSNIVLNYVVKKYEWWHLEHLLEQEEHGFIDDKNLENYVITANCFFLAAHYNKLSILKYINHKVSLYLRADLKGDCFGVGETIVKSAIHAAAENGFRHILEWFQSEGVQFRNYYYYAEEIKHLPKHVRCWLHKTVEKEKKERKINFRNFAKRREKLMIQGY
jgi:hypothetical protein